MKSLCLAFFAALALFGSARFAAADELSKLATSSLQAQARAEDPQQRVKELNSLRDEMAQVHSVPAFLAIAEKLTTRPFDEDDLLYILRAATGPAGSVASLAISNISMLAIPMEIRGERQRTWDEHFLNRSELRARILQLVVSLYARLAAVTENQPVEVQEKWLDIVGVDLDATMITIERGYASPDQLVVTKEYLKSVLRPVMAAALNAFVDNSFYSDPKTKFKFFVEAVQTSISFARRSRLEVIKAFFKENVSELPSIWSDPLALIGIAAKSVVNIFKDERLHYESRRPLFNSEERVEVESYPRLTQHVIQALFKELNCRDITTP